MVSGYSDRVQGAPGMSRIQRSARDVKDFV